MNEVSSGAAKLLIASRSEIVHTGWTARLFPWQSMSALT